jgi:hypothetical protein
VLLLLLLTKFWGLLRPTLIIKLLLLLLLLNFKESLSPVPFKQQRSMMQTLKKRQR